MLNAGVIYYTLQYEPGPSEWEGITPRPNTGANGTFSELRHGVSTRVDAKR